MRFRFRAAIATAGAVAVTMAASACAEYSSIRIYDVQTRGVLELQVTGVYPAWKPTP